MRLGSLRRRAFRRLGVGLLASIVLLVFGALSANAQRPLLLGSTTSMRDSGLLPYLLDLYRGRSGQEVQAIVMGTGQIFVLGRNGDVDLLLVHDPVGEEAFIAQGYGSARIPIAYNDYLFLGPRSDPAGLALAPDLKTALTRLWSALSQERAVFFSRGDDSGTHRREQALWAMIGSDPRQQAAIAYREAGAGMGATLNLASDQNGYTLSDRATWLSFSNPGNLTILHAGDEALKNQYSLVLLNHAQRRPTPMGIEAQTRAFAAWLTGAEGQAAIADFYLKGQRVFTPNALSNALPNALPNALARHARKSPDTAAEPSPNLGAAPNLGAPPKLGAALLHAFRLLRSRDREVLEIIGLSIFVCLTSTMIASAIAFPLAAALALYRFPLRGLIVLLINTCFGLPPVVIGLIVYLLLSRAGPLGTLGLIFTPTAMIIAQVILITPIIAAIAYRSLRDLWQDLALHLRAMGTRGTQAGCTLLWEARTRLPVAWLAGFGRAISEVGAVMIVGGNIDHHTRVMTTAVSLALSRGELALALALGVVLLTLGVIVNLLLAGITSRAFK